MAAYDKQRAATADYVQKHKIQELFSHLLQLVVHARPENPRQYMAEEVARLMKGAEPTRLLTDDELSMMFELIDVTKQKTISLGQCRNAYANLSTDGSKLEDSQLPQRVHEAQRVTQEEFSAIIGGQLRTANHWKKQ
jgi:Mg2+/Co2+ transporter CorC